MSESAKTLTFVGIAVLSVVVALATQPSSADLDLTSLVGQKFASFGAEDAKRLKIVKFNEDTATLSDFEVAQDDAGVWTLPSKNGYPADAQQQMGEAAGSLLDLEKLDIVTESAADHERYSVIDPNSPKLEVGQEGVGTRVTIADISDDNLIDIIIGTEVKDATNQYYVREANRPIVYITEIDPSKLSTNFEDWIEDDLLKLNPWDIRKVRINDYSAELVLVGFQPQIQWDRRGEYELSYDDSKSEWQVESLRTYDRDANDFVAADLSESEELNTQMINDLKSALDDLKIVDVERKPLGLSANLKAGGDFLKDNEALSSLVRRGFAAVPVSGEDLEILSSEGEVIATMKNGVEYVLRFGNLQVSGDGDSIEPSAEGEAASKDNVNRFLFAMVRFNEDAVEKPELEDLPELPAESEAENTAEATESDKGDQDESAVESEQASETEEAPADGSGEAEAAADTESGNESETDADDKAAELEKIIAERKRIETENQRKLDRYKEDLEKGREEVEELNLRFGDWYYVISNDVFQKIHLDRSDLVKEKETTEDETNSAVPAE